MPTIAVRIPKDLTPKEAKALLSQALDQRIDPSPIGLVQTSSGKIAVDAVQLAKLERLSKTQAGNLTPQDIASRLIQSMHHAMQRAAARGVMEQTLDKVIASGAIKHRPGQSDAAITMRTTLTSEGVLMLEAPTGVGKTMAELCAAVDALNHNPEELIVIAVPAIHLMHQIENEYAVIQSVLADEAPDIGYIIGRDKFVSVDALKVIIADPENASFIQASELWLRSAKKTGESISHMSYQAHALYEAVPGIPPCTIDSGTSEEDPGMLAYRAQFIRAKSVGILVVTHSMLALDTKMKRIKAMQEAKKNGESAKELKAAHDALVKSGDAEEKNFYAYLTEHHADYEVSGVLPAFDRLIVDEGHMLEQSFARMTSDELSLYSVIKNLSLAESSKKELRGLFAQLVSIGAAQHGKEQIELAHNKEALLILSSIHGLLVKSRKKDAALQNAVHVLQSLIANAGRPGFLSTIDYSPIYTYPRLRVGAKSVFMYMQFLWTSIRSGAVISATLLLPSSQGGWSSSYTARQLSIPSDLVRLAHIPAPEWLSSPVTVFLPDAVNMGGRFWLQPPSAPKGELDTARARAKYEADIELWIGELAPVLTWVVDTAVGGTLMLLPSYDLAGRLEKQLAQYADRLVTAKRDVHQVEQKRRFEALYAAGIKPIWLAVGGAWTGLNLVDNAVPPEQDLMLTDLVIPRMPMRMNRSITHEMRVASLGWTMEFSEILMLMKQGIGRLVRREGILKNRRIFILDGRVYDRNRFAVLFSGIEKLIANYTKNKVKYR